MRIKTFLFVGLLFGFPFAANDSLYEKYMDSSLGLNKDSIHTMETKSIKKDIQPQKQLTHEDSVVAYWRARRLAQLNELLHPLPNWTTKECLGFLTIVGGIVSGIITIVDATGPVNKGNIHQWTKYHTLNFALSISAITAGASCFYK